VDLVSRLLQYSPHLRCTAVSLFAMQMLPVSNYKSSLLS